MEGIYGVLKCNIILYGLFSDLGSKCYRWYLVGFHAGSSPIHYYILYMDFKSEIYKKAKEMDAGFHGSDFIFMDSLSSRNNRVCYAEFPVLGQLAIYVQVCLGIYLRTRVNVIAISR